MLSFTLTPSYYRRTVFKGQMKSIQLLLKYIFKTLVFLFGT